MFTPQPQKAERKIQEQKITGQSQRWIDRFWERLSLISTAKGGEVQEVVFVSRPELEISYINASKRNAWLEGKEHVNKISEKEFPWTVCSAGHDRYNKQPCVGCAIADTTESMMNKDKKPNPWKAKTFSVFQLVHLDWYNRELRMKNGEPVRYKDVPQYNIVKGKGKDSFFGRLLKLKVGQKQWKNLIDIWNDVLFWMCDGCGTEIVTKQLVCTGCRKDLIDPSEIQKMPRNKLFELMINDQTCSECNLTALPFDINQCGYKNGGKTVIKKHSCDYPNPERMNLFNCVLGICKKGTNNDTVIGFESVFSLNPKSAIYYTAPEGMTIETIVDEAIKRNGFYDLESEFSPLDLEQQATILKVPNPYKEVPIKTEQAPIPQNPTTKLSKLVFSEGGQ
jgi:hypothetical protein